MISLEDFHELINHQSKKNESLYGPDWRHSFRVKGKKLNIALKALIYLVPVTEGVSRNADITKYMDSLVNSFACILSLYIQQLDQPPVMFYMNLLGEEEVLTHLLFIERSLIKITIDIEKRYEDYPYLVLNQCEEDISYILSLFFGFIHKTVGLETFMQHFLERI